MSNDNDNNEEDEIKTKRTTFNVDIEDTTKNQNNAIPRRNSVLAKNRRFSKFEIVKNTTKKDDTTDSINIDSPSKDYMKKNSKMIVLNKKKKKKGKKKKKDENEPVLLTEVKNKIIPQKVETEKKESVTHKFLREKLEKLNFTKNLQLGINSGFEKINEDLKDNIVDNFNIKDKKINLEDIINKTNKKKPEPEINLGKNGIIFNLNRESKLRLKHLKQNEKSIKNKLSIVDQRQKLLEIEEPIKNDIVYMNLRDNNLKKINSMKNSLLLKLKTNSSIISEVIDKDKIVKRNLLIQNYNNNTNKTELGSFSKHFSLSEDQEKFNKYLLKKQKEEKIQREKVQNEMKRSNNKKNKEIKLNEEKLIEKQKEHLNELKKREKEFFNKLKEKNNLLIEKSIKNIDKSQKKQTKDYLFYQVKQKYENNEKKLVDKINMMKKDSLVTKEELEELANKRNERKKILEDDLSERKINLIKMWKYRSQKLPVYKHPIVNILEDEHLDKIEDEEEQQEQKEKNEQTKKSYQPPPVRVNPKLKKIREKRFLISPKESVTQTETENKKRLLKNLDFMANIIEAAKEENMEKNKLKMNHNIKTEKNKNQKIRIVKSLDTNENRKKHNYQLHPKPEKPIDYLKEIMKGKKGNKRIEKKDEGVGDMLAELKDHNHTIKGRNQIIDTLDMIKSKTTAIDQKVSEKKEFMKVKGGYINNTNIGDEVGDLLIESIQTKLSLLNKLKGK